MATVILLGGAGVIALLAPAWMPALSETSSVSGHPRPGPRSIWILPDFGSASVPEKLALASLVEFRNTAFFDPDTADPIVSYAITAQGKLELFRGSGLHPTTGEPLKPVTRVVVQQLERRLKAAEQERLGEEERRAATGRADAEIALARKALRSRDSASAYRSTDAPTGPRTRVPADLREDDARPEGSPLPARSGIPSVARVEPDIARNAVTAGEDRATTYDALVGSARALIDAGRLAEARDQAQRALHVDPSRGAARSLWAEAQTGLDARDRFERAFNPSGRARR